MNKIMSWLKKKFKIILLAIFGISVAYATSYGVPFLGKEADPSDIRSIVEFDEYTDKDGVIEIKYTYKDKEIIGKDILSESAERLAPNKILFHSGAQFLKENSKWYELKYATTTKVKFAKPVVWNVFNSAKAVSPLTAHSSQDGSIDYAGDLNYETGHDATNGSTTACPAGGNQRPDGMWTKEGNNTYSICRGVVWFDTSSIGAGQVVTAATLTLKQADSSGSLVLNIYAHTGSGQTTTNGDYSAMGTTQFSTGATPWGLNTTHDFVLNATGQLNINMTGTSKFALRGETEAETHTAPTVGAYLSSYGSEDGEGSDPVLVVTYSAAPSVPPVINRPGVIFFDSDE